MVQFRDWRTGSDQAPLLVCAVSCWIIFYHMTHYRDSNMGLGQLIPLRVSSSELPILNKIRYKYNNITLSGAQNSANNTPHTTRTPINAPIQYPPPRLHPNYLPKKNCHFYNEETRKIILPVDLQRI